MEKCEIPLREEPNLFPRQLSAFHTPFGLGSSQADGRIPKHTHACWLDPLELTFHLSEGGLLQLCLGKGDQESSVTADDLYQNGGKF